MNIARDVVIIDPRRRIDVNNPDVISRHLLYASAARKVSKSFLLRLVVWQPRIGQEPELVVLSDNLRIIRTSRPYTGFLISRRKIDLFFKRVDLNPALISCGDPDISYIAGKAFVLMMKKISNTSPPIYVQVHSELNRRLARTNIKTFAKFLVARQSLKNAVRIRATSQLHGIEMADTFRLRIDKIDPIPVPLTGIKTEKIPSRRAKPTKVAFVGRLHKERDADTFLRIAFDLCASRADIHITIIGDGPERSRLESIVINSEFSNRIDFLGELNSEELDLMWESIGVLISTAKHEAYGRATREALIRGVPVLARDSTGTKSLLMEVPENWVKVIKDPVRMEVVRNQVNELLLLTTDDSFLKQQNKLQREIPNEMILSWLKAISFSD